MDIIFGTKNLSKIDYMRTVLKDLPLNILSLENYNINFEVTENGNTPLENAYIKAKAYYQKIKKPVFSLDSGLWLDKLPTDKQPGVYIRRQNGKVLSDAELLAYFIRMLEKMGGESFGKWQIGICIIISEKDIYQGFVEDTWLFRSKPSQIQIPGAPLSSLQYHQHLQKYKTEMLKDETEVLAIEMSSKFVEFFNNCLESHFA